MEKLKPNLREIKSYFRVSKRYVCLWFKNTIRIEVNLRVCKKGMTFKSGLESCCLKLECF